MTSDAVNPHKSDKSDGRQLSPEQAAAAAMVAEARQRGLELTGPDGLLKLFTKNVLETALNEEITEHLGYEKNRAEPGRRCANVRNGARAKTVISDAAGEIRIDVPPRPGRDFRAADREEKAAPADRRGRDRAVAVCEGTDDGRDLGAFRRDLRRVYFEGNRIPDHREGRGRDAGVGQPPAGCGVRGRLHR